MKYLYDNNKVIICQSGRGLFEAGSRRYLAAGALGSGLILALAEADQEVSG